MFIIKYMHIFYTFYIQNGQKHMLLQLYHTINFNDFTRIHSAMFWTLYSFLWPFWYLWQYICSIFLCFLMASKHFFLYYSEGIYYQQDLVVIVEPHLGLIFWPLSLNPSSLSNIPYSLSLIRNPLILIPYPLFVIPYPLSLFPYPLPLIP